MGREREEKCHKFRKKRDREKERGKEVIDGAWSWRIIKLPAVLCPPDHPFKNKADEKFEELQKLRIRVAELESELGMKKGSNSLKFKVDHLFAVGSPLGIFLMLCEHSPLVKDSKGADSLLPSAICKRIHNVHHPSDPVVSLVSTM